MSFADPKRRKAFQCEGCGVWAQRKCREPGYENLKTPLSVDTFSLKYSFCPAKATWDVGLAVLFAQCRVAYQCGIMPLSGGMEDQTEEFAEVFPAFVDRWRERIYRQWWEDISSFTTSVLKSLFPKKD